MLELNLSGIPCTNPSLINNFFFYSQYFNSLSQTQHQLQLIPPSQYNKAYGYGSNSIHLDDLHMVLKSKTIFSAMFPKLSMMNHSCDPNTRPNLNGATISVYAAQNIDKNEEIFACYGPHYKLVSKAERKAQLQMEFCFECKCSRCESNDTTSDQYFEYYCPNEKCHSPVELIGVDFRWWYYITNVEYSDRIDTKFECNECGTRLPVNPTIYRKFERTAQGHIDKGYTFYSTDNHLITSSLMDLYFKASKCLGKYHELKSRWAHIILGYRMLGEC